MNCPVCESTMREIEQYNVEIDICPKCKGVWLDRGEIEKIAQAQSLHDQHHKNLKKKHYDEKGYHKKKKKMGFLEDLLDF